MPTTPTAQSNSAEQYSPKEMELVNYHRNTIANKQVGQDEQGNPVTVYIATVQIPEGPNKGKFVNVPGYFDGKTHNDDGEIYAKWRNEIASGKWPTYDNVNVADQRAKQVHSVMDNEVESARQALQQQKSQQPKGAMPTPTVQTLSAPPAPVGSSTRMMEMRRGPGVGEMDPPTVSPLRQPQPQAFTPRAQAQMAMRGMPQFGTEQIQEDAYQVGKYEMATPLPGHSALAGSQASKGNLAERDYWRKENMRAEREALELPEGIPLQPKPYVQPDEDILRFRPLRPLRDY